MLLLSPFIFLSLILSQHSIAQWSSNPAINNAISAATGNQNEPQVISDGAGGAIIMWLDFRNGISNIYAQRVNASGALQWTADGVAISAAAGGKFRPKIVSDEAGGAIITWVDHRSRVEDIFAQRINNLGIVQWGADGVNVCAAANDQSAPSLVSDGAGGAIITWVDFRNIVNYVYYAYVYAQHIDASGAALWTADGVAVCLLPEYKNSLNIISDGAGGAIIAWQDFRNLISDIYAQRIDASGAALWTADGIAVCRAAADQFMPKIVSDGAGGAIITWYDTRNGAGYADIYAQRVDALGAMQWAVNGAAVCTEGGYQSNPQIVSDGAGGAIIAWYDYRTGSNSDIYAQRVNTSGAGQWTANGVPVCVAAGNQSIPAISSDGAGGATIAWADARSISADIYAQHFNASGAAQWGADGVAVSTAAGTQDKPTVVSDAGGAIVTWMDSRNGNNDIYAQNVKSNGTLGCNSPSVTGEPLKEQTVCKTSAATQLTVTATGDDLTYQWYADNDNTGYNGAIISGKTGSAFTPPTTTAGTFYYYVVVGSICGTATSAYSIVTVEPPTIWYQDSDNDGYGNSSVTQMACARPGGYVSQTGDCNDADADIRPGATEICNGKDDDCNGQVDEGLAKKTYYKDEDCDGYGDLKKCITTCEKCPKGYVPNNKDCNDRDKTIYPGAPELCDGKDNDCDDKVDEYLTKKNYYKDYDKDGYGDSKECKVSCTCPSGYVPNNKDCNDRDKTIYPGAPELCDNKDNDCDGKVDEYLTKKSYYKDNDKDGYGDPKECKVSCTCPSGYVTNNKDCNDRNKNIHPGTKEIPGNKIDDNCNGKVDEKTSSARGINHEELAYDEPADLVNTTNHILKVKALPNPSPTYFTLNIKGGSDKPVQLRVLDISGRVVEVKNNVPARSNLTIGQNYRPGVYFVEVAQESERMVIRCIKQ